MKNKGKQKYFLFLKRKQEKILRRIQRKSKKKYIVNSCSNDITECKSQYGETSKIINTFDQKKSRIRFPVISSFNDKASFSIPSIFSVSENPENVIRFIWQFYDIINHKSIKNIELDYSCCNNLGLSASVILNVIATVVDDFSRSINKSLVWSVTPSNEKYVRDIVRVGDLPHHTENKLYSNDQTGDIKHFSLTRGSHDPQKKKAGIVATELTNYFDKCLHTQKFMLNDFGKSLFSDMLGEVITNCEIHGGNNSMWYTQGYYKIIDKSNIGEMQLVFLSIGDSIYEGLKNDVKAETKKKLEHIVKMQSQYITETWNEETIYTVLALQEGISRLRTDKIQGYEFRGSGTVNLIERFYTIGGTKYTNVEPKMTIVSGHTHIQFSDKYRLKKQKFNDDPIFGNTNCRIIAFNSTNDIYKPADPNYVKYMDEYFPGTIISLKFYLDRSYIEEKKKG